MGGHKDLFTTWMQDVAEPEQLTLKGDALIQEFLNFKKRVAPSEVRTDKEESAYSQGFSRGWDEGHKEGQIKAIDAWPR